MMGSLFSKKREISVLLTGLDEAGKTALLYRLKLREVLPNLNHTTGCNVETIEHNGVSFTIYDVGGGHKIRPLWTQNFKETKDVIFVVDSNDRERLKEAKDRLRIEDEVREHGAGVFLVFANKQDIPGAMTVKEIEEKLDLQSLHNRNWHILGCSVTSECDQDLYEGLDWLAEQRMMKN